MARIWNRIEPNNTTVDLEAGLRAPVADPLWMMARQWQLGEFRGEDAARPAKARLTVSVGTVETFASTGAPEPLSRGWPMECRAEAERVVGGPAGIRLSADAGLQLVRRLDAAGLGGLRGKLRTAFPLSIASVELGILPPRQQRELTILARHAIDGARVAAAADPLAEAAVPSEQRGDAGKVLDAWRDELGLRIREPQGDAAWNEGALEYHFSVGARTPAGEVVMTSRYPGGHLDWYSFDVSRDVTHGLTTGGSTKTFDANPIHVQYRGMPASRYWEMEDGTVSFGDLAAGPADLARLVIAEHALVYGDDWYVMPLPLRCGSLARVDDLRVIDTFGTHHAVASTALNDGPDRVWTMFELSGDRSVSQGTNPWLFVPATVATSLVGSPVEKVSMVRDEGANLAWGVEQSFEGPTGLPVRRKLLSNAAMPASPPVSDAWAYRLSTPVPPHWIPLTPEPAERGGMVLRRARMQAWDQFPPAVVGARGLFLLPRADGPLRLREEALPRGGLELERAWQLARGSDGRCYLWMSRQKRPGRGERGSGLEMDRIER